MQPDRFFHVAVKTDALDASVDFYRDALGGAIVAESGPNDDVTYAALVVADKRVYCFERAPYEAAGLVDELPTGFLHFGFVVPDAEEAFAELEAVGAEPVMEPSVFDDLKIAFVRAPSGVRVEVLEEL